MIRNLEPDELVWFMRQALAFVEHADPQGLSLRLHSRLKDAAADAARCYVHVPPAGPPTAGLYLTLKGGGNGAKEAQLSSVWHEHDEGALQALVAHLIDREEAELVTVPLHLLGVERAAGLELLLAPLGFQRDELKRLRFELTDVPPLGSPLVLEAWAPGAEGAFRELYEAAEATTVSDARWSYLKRSGGPFQPDLWFVARETLDQDAVGYAFLGATTSEVDAAYRLTAVGVGQHLRADSEMLRRLVLTVLLELAGRSPFGTVEAQLGRADPKLVEILASLGFLTVEVTPVLVKLPA